jgi:hypothetical protein
MEEEMDQATQMQAQARARREELRHEKSEGFYTDVKCFQDQPKQCDTLPKYYIKVLDGPAFYSCKKDAEELVRELPDVPLDGVGVDATLN